METGIAFYSSPIGTIQIKSNGEDIEELIFLNSDKEEKMPGNDNFEIDTIPVIKKCLLQLDEYFKGGRKVFELPISQAGTEFQKKVWNALLDIPYGKTTSYLLLSKSLGNVKAIRAVGAANGKNKISIIVPCHRIIGSKGNMVGYGGEVWRKKWLLEHEAKYENGVQKLF